MNQRRKSKNKKLSLLAMTQQSTLQALMELCHRAGLRPRNYDDLPRVLAEVFAGQVAAVATKIAGAS